MKTEQVAHAMKKCMLVIGMVFATALVGGCGPWGDTRADKLQTVAGIVDLAYQAQLIKLLQFFFHLVFG